MLIRMSGLDVLRLHTDQGTLCFAGQILQTLCLSNIFLVCADTMECWNYTILILLVQYILVHSSETGITLSLFARH